MKFVFSFLVFLSTSIVSFSTLAQEKTGADDVLKKTEQQVENQEKLLEQIRTKLTARIGTKISAINVTPISDLYEVVIGHEIVYTDKNADYLIMGQLFNTLDRRNLTEEAKERLNKVDFSRLPFEDAIKTVKGDGSRKMVVFSDPNCSFCKKLEVNLRNLNNVTIYTFLYPVITPGSKEVSADIWCDKDSSRAWKEVMIDGKLVAKRNVNCDIGALERNIKLGEKLNITGTPTTIFSSGLRVPGAATADYLEKILTENK